MKRSVLVVDDDPLILRILSTILDLEEFEVATAEDGDQALVMLAESTPHLVVTDVMMPGMDGFDLCEKIKADVSSKLPVILLTAREDDEAVGRGKTCGADAFLTKPFSPLELIDAIESLLGKA